MSSRLVEKAAPPDRMTSCLRVGTRWLAPNVKLELLAELLGSIARGAVGDVPLDSGDGEVERPHFLVTLANGPIGTLFVSPDPADVPGHVIEELLAYNDVLGLGTLVVAGEADVRLFVQREERTRRARDGLLDAEMLSGGQADRAPQVTSRALALLRPRRVGGGFEFGGASLAAGKTIDREYRFETLYEDEEMRIVFNVPPYFDAEAFAERSEARRASTRFTNVFFVCSLKSIMTLDIDAQSKAPEEALGFLEQFCDDNPSFAFQVGETDRGYHAHCTSRRFKSADPFCWLFAAAAGSDPRYSVFAVLRGVWDCRIHGKAPGDFVWRSGYDARGKRSRTIGRAHALRELFEALRIKEHLALRFDELASPWADESPLGPQLCRWLEADKSRYDVAVAGMKARLDEHVGELRTRSGEGALP